jgi:hypothetical protein
MPKAKRIGDMKEKPHCGRSLQPSVHENARRIGIRGLVDAELVQGQSTFLFGELVPTGLVSLLEV